MHKAACSTGRAPPLYAARTDLKAPIDKAKQMSAVTISLVWIYRSQPHPFKVKVGRGFGGRYSQKNKDLLLRNGLSRLRAKHKRNSLTVCMTRFFTSSCGEINQPKLKTSHTQMAIFRQGFFGCEVIWIPERGLFSLWSMRVLVRMKTQVVFAYFCISRTTFKSQAD